MRVAACVPGGNAIGSGPPSLAIPISDRAASSSRSCRRHAARAEGRAGLVGPVLGPDPDLACPATLVCRRTGATRPAPGGARRLPGPPRVLRLGRVDGTNELGPGLRLKGEETGSSFQSWRASVPAAHGTPRGGNSSRPPGTSGPDPETPCSSPRVSAPPSRSDERHGADEDRAGDHPARGGSSDWRSLRKSSRALSSRNSLKSSCFASLIKPFSTAF